MTFSRNSAFSEPHLFPLRAYQKARALKSNVDPEIERQKTLEAWYNEVNDLVHTFDDRVSSDNYRNPGLLERLTDLRDDIYKELK